MYRPSEMSQMTTAMQIMKVSESVVLGVLKKSYAEGDTFLCNYKTYGGTERTSNDIRIVEDTADIVTWYRPDITAKCRIKRCSDGAMFEVIGTPEDIEQRHQIMKFKIQRIRGGA